MKLTETERIFLKKRGYSDKDFPQIEMAIDISEYHLYNNQEKSVSITSEKAIKLLGKEEFLSGIARSAFHWSAVRVNNNIKILFDSKRLFH